MPAKLEIRVLIGSVAFVALAGVATAQPGTAAPTPGTAPAPPQAGQGEPTLTPSQMLSEAKSYLPGMDRAAATVRRQLADAREKRDVLRCLCLNDKLNQIDLAIRSATDRVETLAAAVAQNDPIRSKHEVTVVQVLRDRVTALIGEANQCIGEEAGFIGESRVIVDIDPNIPGDGDFTVPTDVLISEPPVLTSPVR